MTDYQYILQYRNDANAHYKTFRTRIEAIEFFEAIKGNYRFTLLKEIRTITSIIREHAV